MATVKIKPDPVVKIEPNVRVDLNVDANSKANIKLINPSKDAPLPSDPETSRMQGVASVSSTFQVALENETKVEVRVDRKEKGVKHGLSFLKCLASLLEKHLIAFPEFKEWIDQSEAIIAQVEVPRILIGVLGYTGSGKSSLINALVDEEMIVPCNAMRASTSVVVEISWNRSDDPEEAYAADIEFITVEEWISEIEILAHDITNRPQGEQLSAKSGSDASVAFSKLSAVYPGIDIDELVDITAEELLQKRDLSDILGQTLVVKEENSKTFSQSINRYIDSSNKVTGSRAAYWPLVRLVKIYVKSPVLEHGLVLVDLPGVGDSNAGRAQIAEKYMNNLHHIWVVADIVRAIDDQVAKDLMGKSFRRRLLMDDKYDDNYITFVMTKTDQINIEEVINSLHLEESTLKKELKQEIELQAIIEEAEDQIEAIAQQQRKNMRILKSLNEEEKAVREAAGTKGRKRKFEENDESPSPLTKSALKLDTNRLKEIALQRQQLVKSRNDGSRDEKSLKTNINKTKKMLAAQKNLIRTICIIERNKYTQEHLQQDFEGGFLELEEELRQTEEVSKAIVTNREGSSRTSLKTFCVSSKAYQKLNGRFKREGNAKGFPTPNDTQILELQAFAEKSTMAQREEIGDKFLTELNLMNVSIRAWAQKKNLKAGLTLLQKEDLKKVLDEHFQVLKEASCKAHKNMLSNIQNSIYKNLLQGLEQAVNAGAIKARDLCEHLGSGEISPMTWKAICKRGGTFRNSKKVRYDWNEAFSEVFLSPLTLYWSSVLHNKMTELHTVYSTKLIESLGNFVQNLRLSIAPICGPSYKPFQDILAQVPYLEDQIRMKVLESLKLSKENAQAIHHDIKPLIKGRLQPVYKACLAESGSGMFVRMKRHLSDHGKIKSQAMYQGVSNMVMAKLKKMTNNISRKMSAASKAGQDKLHKDLQRVIMSAGFGADGVRPEAAKLALQSAMMAELEKLDKAWTKVLENPAAQLRAAKPFAKSSVVEGDADGLADDDDDYDGSEASGEEDDSKSKNDESEDNDSEDDEVP